MTDYRVLRRSFKIAGVTYGPGDVIPGGLCANGAKLVKIGWLEPVEAQAPQPEPEESPVDAGELAGETTPTVVIEPEPEPPKPVKKKRGRPRKKKVSKKPAGE